MLQSLVPKLSLHIFSQGDQKHKNLPSVARNTKSYKSLPEVTQLITLAYPAILPQPQRHTTEHKYANNMH